MLLALAQAANDRQIGLRSPSPVVESPSSGTSSCGRFATFPTSAFEGRRPDPLLAILREFRTSEADRGLSGPSGSALAVDSALDPPLR